MEKLFSMKRIIFSTCLIMTLGLVVGCDRSTKIEDQTKSSDATLASTKAAPAAATPATTPSAAQPTDQTKDNTNEVAVIKTSYGEMVIAFWPDVAPNTVANFKKLARQGFYDKTAFHRIMKGFMIQGGDPNTKDPAKEAMYGMGDPGYKIKAEFNPRPHVRGVLSMARSNDPDSAGSQFFICLGDASFLNNKYTAFGQVIKGDDVLGKLGDVAVGPSASGEPSKPLARQEVESIKIVPADSIK